MPDRFWEIDFARGLAIVLMLIFNWSNALDYLGIYPMPSTEIYRWLFPRLVASMFIVIAGIVLALGYARDKNPRKYLKRGAYIFSFGLLITAVTYVFVPKDFIVFGILHFIGLAIAISPFYLGRSNNTLLILSGLVLAAGFFLQNVYFSFPWLVWLGLMPSGFQTLDYFPMLPWLGIMLLGVVLGRMYNVKKSKEPFLAKPLSFLGRHSLLIYLVHQPLLLLVLHLLGLF